MNYQEGNSVFFSIPFESLVNSRIVYRKLKNAVILTLFCLICYLLYCADSIVSGVAASIISVFALLPLILWCSAANRSLPVFPLFSISFIWCYATPLVIGHEKVIQFNPTQHIQAATYVSLFLLIGTLSWKFASSRKTRSPRNFSGFDQSQYKNILLWIVITTLFFNLTRHLQLLSFMQFFVDSIFIALEIMVSLAIFILGYLYGANKLSKFHRRLYIILLVSLCYVQSLSFILFACVAKLVIALSAITLGRKKIPFLLASILLPLFIVLHFGKYEMRGKYWQYNAPQVSILEIPGQLVEWYGYSFDFLLSKREGNIGDAYRGTEKSNQRRFFERVSLMHMFLESITRAGNDVPFMYGSSYTVIPEALVPRVINPYKISVHEALYRINILFGHQTRGHTRYTHIAWGLLAEAWANFGLIGVVFLGVIIGLVTGWVARWSIGFPLFSFRAGFAALFAGILINANSMTFAALTVSLLQSFVVLYAVKILFMKKIRLEV